MERIHQLPRPRVWMNLTPRLSLVNIVNTQNSSASEKIPKFQKEKNQSGLKNLINNSTLAAIKVKAQRANKFKINMT